MAEGMRLSGVGTLVTGRMTRVSRRYRLVAGMLLSTATILLAAGCAQGPTPVKTQSAKPVSPQQQVTRQPTRQLPSTHTAPARDSSPVDGSTVPSNSAASASPGGTSAEYPAIRINPGYGNAGKVCNRPRIGQDSPRLSPRHGRNLLSTGFYRIGRMPDNGTPVSLEVRPAGGDVGPSLEVRPATAEQSRQWLMTQVGADLYQIATCVEEVAWCLSPDPVRPADSEVVLAPCDAEALGTQAWWLTQIRTASNEWGIELGSDGLGRLVCLDERRVDQVSVPAMVACGPETRDVAWRIER